jgi:hypothetical protein
LIVIAKRDAVAVAEIKNGEAPLIITPRRW